MNVKNGNITENIVIKILNSKGILLKHNKTKGIDLLYKFNDLIIKIEVKGAIRKKYKNSHFFIHLSQIFKNNIFAFIIYDSNKKFLKCLFVKSLNLLNIPNKNYISKFLISERQLKLYCKPKTNILDVL